MIMQNEANKNVGDLVEKLKKIEVEIEPRDWDSVYGKLTDRSIKEILSVIRQQSSVKADLVPEYAKEGDYIYATIKAYHPDLTESEMKSAGHTHYLGQTGVKSSVKVDDGERIKQLEHYRDSSLGLWCIDRNPKDVDYEWIKRNAFQLEDCVAVECKQALRSSEMPNSSGKED